MIKLLFVCTGNICRSPTAEGVFHDLAQKAGLEEHFYIDSAGTSPGRIHCPPDRRSAQECLKNGIDISSLRSREVTPADIREFDYILAMTQEHHRYLVSLAPADAGNKVMHFMKFIEGARDLDVPDPYIGEDGFEEVFELIRTGSIELLSFIRERHKI